MLAEFELGDLACGIYFCLAVLVSLEKDKKWNDNELKTSKED